MLKRINAQSPICLFVNDNFLQLMEKLTMMKKAVEGFIQELCKYGLILDLQDFVTKDFCLI